MLQQNDYVINHDDPHLLLWLSAYKLSELFPFYPVRFSYLNPSTVLHWAASFLYVFIPTFVMCFWTEIAYPMPAINRAITECLRQAKE